MLARRVLSQARTGRAVRIGREPRDRGQDVERRMTMFHVDREATNQLRLTPREHDVLRQISRGFSNKEIAKTLGCALKTVECHITSLLRKFNVTSRLQLVLRQQGRPQGIL
jgi:DNA-binding NarL/FixJ family response regulator